MNQANPFNSEIPKFRSYLTLIAFERWYTSLKQLRNNISIIYLRITKWTLQQKYTNKFCDSLSFILSVQGTRMKQKMEKKEKILDHLRYLPYPNEKHPLEGGTSHDLDEQK